MRAPSAPRGRQARFTPHNSTAAWLGDPEAPASAPAARQALVSSHLQFRGGPMAASLPLHARYQAPSAARDSAAVPLPRPVVLAECDGRWRRAPCAWPEVTPRRWNPHPSPPSPYASPTVPTSARPRVALHTPIPTAPPYASPHRTPTTTTVSPRLPARAPPAPRRCGRVLTACVLSGGRRRAGVSSKTRGACPWGGPATRSWCVASRWRPPPPPPPPRTKWTRRVPHPVLIGHAASLSQVRCITLATTVLGTLVALAATLFMPARAGRRRRAE